MAWPVLDVVSVQERTWTRTASNINTWMRKWINFQTALCSSGLICMQIIIMVTTGTSNYTTVHKSSFYLRIFFCLLTFRSATLSDSSNSWAALQRIMVGSQLCGVDKCKRKSTHLKPPSPSLPLLLLLLQQFPRCINFAFNWCPALSAAGVPTISKVSAIKIWRGD